jgi:hypothetical protein
MPENGRARRRNILKLNGLRCWTPFLTGLSDLRKGSPLRVCENAPETWDGVLNHAPFLTWFGARALRVERLGNAMTSDQRLGRVSYQAPGG